jgi:uracil-DNA glycosylase
LAVYSNILLNGNVSLDCCVLSEILEKIIFLNGIKCSPKGKEKGDNSKPEAEMYNYCPKNILFKEIEILKPKIILFLGKDISNIMKTMYNCKNNDSTRNIRYYEIINKENIIKVFDIIHPTYRRGGNSVKLYNELLELRNKK